MYDSSMFGKQQIQITMGRDLCLPCAPVGEHRSMYNLTILSKIYIRLHVALSSSPVNSNEHPVFVERHLYVSWRVGVMDQLL